MSTVIVARGKFHRKVDHPQLFIHTDLAPHTRVAGIIRGVLLPSVVTELSRLGDGMEDPQTLAGPRVESAYVALDVGLAAGNTATAVRGAHNHGIASYDWGGM